MSPADVWIRPIVTNVYCTFTMGWAHTRFSDRGLTWLTSLIFKRIKSKREEEEKNKNQSRKRVSASPLLCKETESTQLH